MSTEGSKLIFPDETLVQQNVLIESMSLILKILKVNGMYADRHRYLNISRNGDGGGKNEQTQVGSKENDKNDVALSWKRLIYPTLVLVATWLNVIHL